MSVVESSFERVGHVSPRACNSHAWAGRGSHPAVLQVRATATVSGLLPSHGMRLQQLTAAFLIGVPVLFNWAYIQLARSFDYPQILRKEPGEILTRFAAGGWGLILYWHLLVISALGMIPLVVLVAATVSLNGVLPFVGLVVGIIAAVVQAIGLIRWPYVVPELARRYVAAEGPDAEATRRTVEVAFSTIHRLLGVAIGEHLGYLLTGIWTIVLSVGLLIGDQGGPGLMPSTAFLPGLLGVAGILIGIAMLIGALEFVGPWERDGLGFAGTIASMGYLAWSIWLVVFGIGLLLSPATTDL